MVIRVFVGGLENKAKIWEEGQERCVVNMVCVVNDEGKIFYEAVESK